MSAPLTRVTVDEHTEAELQPRCDCATVLFHPDTMTVVDQKQCDQPAAFVLRSHCACGHVAIDLICLQHRAQVRALSFFCPHCRKVCEPIRQELERL